MRAWDRSYNRETHETWQVWWWSMVAHTCHGKTKNFMAKTKTSRQNKKPHGKNKIPHSKSKIALFCHGYLLLLWGTGIWFLLWSIWFCREVFGFVVRYFVFAVRFSVLPWGILFLPWGFWFCREVFCFCHEVFGFAVTVVGHRSGQNTVSTILQLFYRLQYITKWPESYYFSKFIYIFSGKTVGSLFFHLKVLLQKLVPWKDKILTESFFIAHLFTKVEDSNILDQLSSVRLKKHIANAYQVTMHGLKSL